MAEPVWLLRRRPLGTQRIKTWFKPEELVRRIEEDTYRIQVGPRQVWEQHESQFRASEPDVCGKHVFANYTAHEADWDNNYAEQDNYHVEKILAQHQNASAPGGVELKVRWRGYVPSRNTLERVSSFLPRINTPSWSTSAGTRPRSRSLTWGLSPRRLEPWAVDPRPKLCPQLVDCTLGAHVCQVVRTSLV